MALTFDEIIFKVKQLDKSGRDQEAMSLANELVARHSDKAQAWLLRGHLHALGKDYAGASADLTRAIEINALEPHFFLSRGKYRFLGGENALAVEDFSKGLELSDYHRNDYYRETLYFWRAEALLKLGRRSEALSDLAHVRDDFRFWTYELRTKADLLSDCRNEG